MKKNIRIILPSLFFLTFLMLIQSEALQGQIRPRAFVDSMQAAHNNRWYIPANYQFEVRYPKLQAIPPLSTGMDYETLLSYIYLDSLMRNTNRHYIYADYLDRWNKEKVKNDTIIGAVKYLYKIVDYNPVSFQQYTWNTGSSYQIGVLAVRGWIEELLDKIIGEHTVKALTYSDMMRSDYILKVHVNSIDVLPEREYPNKDIMPGEYIYQVHATVLDTLKGRVFKNCSPQLLTKDHNEIQTGTAEICFNYVTGPYANIYTPFKLDPSLKDPSGNLSLQPGQDLIVILDHGNYLWDYNYDYFNLSIITVYPIIDGQVKDISHIWSSSDALNYEDWKDVFFGLRDVLLNGEY